MSYLQIKNISKSFYGVKALNNISLDLELGEIHVVIGENGAGKSPDCTRRMKVRSSLKEIRLR